MSDTPDKPGKKKGKKRTPAAGVPGRDSKPSIDSGPVSQTDSGPVTTVDPSRPFTRPSSPVIEAIPDEASASAAVSAAITALQDDHALVVAARRASSPAIDTEAVRQYVRIGTAPVLAPESTPEPVAHASTMPTPAGVPMPIEAAHVEAVVAPLEVARTKPLELPTREPSLPSFTASEAAPRAIDPQDATSRKIELIADEPSAPAQPASAAAPARPVGCWAAG